MAKNSHQLEEHEWDRTPDDITLSDSKSGGGAAKDIDEFLSFIVSTKSDKEEDSRRPLA
ncbi:MAG: hypothetical protein JXA30_13715 [Deltaproteobacteria bacterium]|nr:hypothetical protein [Deltaproteobacteria bacterium]